MITEEAKIRSALSCLRVFIALHAVNEADQKGMLEQLEIISLTKVSPFHDKMVDMLIRLHKEGILSEGQVAATTGLDRVEVREKVYK